MERNSRQEKARIRFYTEEEVMALPEPVWLLEPLLPSGAVAMLYGPSGVGKSFIAMAWAHAIAHGLSWLGRNVRKGSVIYVAGEGGAGLGPRLKALQASA